MEIMFGRLLCLLGLHDWENWWDADAPREAFYECSRCHIQKPDPDPTDYDNPEMCHCGHERKHHGYRGCRKCECYVFMTLGDYEKLDVQGIFNLGIEEGRIRHLYGKNEKPKS